MPSLPNDALKQFGKIAFAAGLAKFVLNAVRPSPRQIHERMNAYHNLVSRYPFVAIELSELVPLGCDERLDDICNMFDQMAIDDMERKYDSQWKMSRMQTRISNAIDVLMKEVKTHESDDTIIGIAVINPLKSGRVKCKRM